MKILRDALLLDLEKDQILDLQHEDFEGCFIVGSRKNQIFQLKTYPQDPVLKMFSTNLLFK